VPAEVTVMRSIAIASVLSLLGFTASLLPADAQAQSQWRSGQIVYTPIYDQNNNYQQNGTGYYVSQAYVQSPPQPVVGQVYYISVLMSAIASPPVGRFMYPHLQLPAGTTVVANAQTPLRCFYRPMSGGNQMYEFTNQVLTDQSFGANLRITGCPQPSQQALPLRNLFNGASGTGIFIQRRDPQSTNEAWPMGSYAAYEFLVPVVSSRTMDGFSNGDRFVAPTYSMQGDGLSAWAYPNLSLLVYPGSGGSGSADMRVSSLNQTTPANPQNLRVLARCQNFGPDSAQNATCSFTLVPPNSTQACTPASGTVASLAVNAFIECWVEFPPSPNGNTVEARAASSTPDPAPNNNGVGINIQPGSSAHVFGNGFEG
jgi:hypothetical protein